MCARPRADRSFNPTLVRFEPLRTAGIIALVSLRFNPTLVRFERTAPTASLRDAVLVSIPHWSDLSKLKNVSPRRKQTGFNPTLVRFELTMTFARKPAEFVSIPHWSDLS